MARGDYIEIIYRTGSGSIPHKMQAKSVGSTIDVETPKSGAFVTVTVADKNGNSLEESKFATSEVIAIISGHETLKR